MGVYLVKGKGWRYDFIQNGARYSKAWFKTKKEAQRSEAKRKEGIAKPKSEPKTQTGITFLDLLNARLDFMREYKTKKYYEDMRYLGRRVVGLWGALLCDEITHEMVQRYILKRARRTHHGANYDLRLLRSLFNFGKKQRLISTNPTEGVEFLPVDRKLKYVPPKKDVLRVILAAEPDTQDYLWTIALTLGRVGEINQLRWADVHFAERYVILYTRKKRGGHLSPRKVAMPQRLYDVLSRRFEQRQKGKPWVFWHRYWNQKEKQWVEGPFKYRERIMRTLCKKAGVKYFSFHALRHFGASLLDQANINTGHIQRILGHENRSTTEIYLHSLGDSEREAMRVFDREMGPGSCEFSHTDSHTEKRKG